MRFKDNVYIQQSECVNGKGCFSAAGYCLDSVMGSEWPVVAAAALYSKRFIDSCCICLRHRKRFRDIVRDLIRDSASGRGRTPDIKMAVWTICEGCGMAVWCSCRSRARTDAHMLLCSRGDPTRMALVKQLEGLGVIGSESLWLASLLFADLAQSSAETQTPIVELFGAMNIHGYFDHHEMDNIPHLSDALNAASELTGVPIPFDLFKKVVETFEQTNLYLEIENESMLDDVHDGLLTDSVVAGLKDAYAVHGYPAMIDQTSPSPVPLPVLIGSGHYQTVAFLNHSCDPNIEWRSVNGTNEIEFVALRDIACGEELFISYIDQTLPRAERRAELLRLYKFACECTLCSRPDS